MADIHVFFKKTDNREDVYKLLEYAVKSLYGIDMPEIRKTEKGKPYFADSNDIHFSLSHSGEYVMCAVSEKPVGADIQIYKAVSDSMRKRVFTEKELENADAISLWCLKESFVKLLGKQDREYRNMEFLKCGNTFCGPDNTQGTALKDISGYAAAVCAEHIENINVSVL